MDKEKFFEALDDLIDAKIGDAVRRLEGNEYDDYAGMAEFEAKRRLREALGLD